MEVTIEVLFTPKLKTLLEDGKPDGVDVRILFLPLQKRHFNYIPIVTIVIDFSTNVAAGLFVAWLLLKIPERARKKITVRKRETVWEKGELTRVIEEELEIEETGETDGKKKKPKK